MKLSFPQRLTVTTGCLICALAGVFPPWVARIDISELHPQARIGFTFLLHKWDPDGSDLELLKRVFPEFAGKETVAPFTTFEVDLRLLMIEWMVIIFVTVALVVVFGSRKPGRSNQS
jgi:hypothetical protein